jgi:DNA-binding HxlR family transcriptional regulator
MTEHPGVSPDHRRVERAIVLQLLRDDHDKQWSRTELQTRLNDVEPAALASALERLEQQGVVLVRSADAILASPCARHIDALGLIGI